MRWFCRTLWIVWLSGLLCWAEAQSVKSPLIEVSYRGTNGVEVKFAGVSLIRETSLQSATPDWGTAYYSSGGTAPRVRTEPAERRLIAEHGRLDSPFTATEVWQIVDDNTLQVTLRCAITQEVPAIAEYCVGYLRAQLLAGATYIAETPTGTLSGTIPAVAKSADREAGTFARAFRKLTLQTRFGTLEIIAEGDNPDIILFDGRKDSQGWAREAPTLWLGYLQFPLQKGLPITVRVTMRFTPVQRTTPIERVAVATRAIPLGEAVGSDIRPIQLIPQPKQVQWREGFLALNPGTRVVALDQASVPAGQSFLKMLRDRYGLSLRLSTGKPSRWENVVVFGLKEQVSHLPRAWRNLLRVPKQPEGYALLVGATAAAVIGTDERGVFYGSQTLQQCLQVRTGGAALKRVLVVDYPALRFRGAHLFLGKDALPFHQKLIERIFSHLKLNHLVLESEYTRWDSAPEIAVDFSMSKTDLQKVIQFARRHFMEVTPLVQSLGHSEWIFRNGQNMDIAEDPTNPHNYCPLNPRTYAFIDAIYDEAIQLFQPRAFHIGHDEIHLFNRFPYHEECKQRGLTQLFVDDILHHYRRFRERSIRTMMWGDMLLHRSESADAAAFAESPEEARRRREMLPKDIIICDWHYQPRPTEEFVQKNLKVLQDAGFEVIATTWYTPMNIYNFAKAAQQAGILGLLQSTWAGFNISEAVLKPAFHQFSAFVLAAEYAWSNGSPPPDQLPYSPEEVFLDLYGRRPLVARPQPGFAVDLSEAMNITAMQSETGGWLEMGMEHDLRNLPRGEQVLGGVRFHLARDPAKPSAVALASNMLPTRPLPRMVHLPIGRRAKALYFLHATGWQVEKNRPVGSYRILYSDNTSETIPLEYGVNICAWDDPSPAYFAKVVWRSQTADGTPVALRALRWDNPHPHKTIAGVEFSVTDDTATPILFAITGVN
ncbi:MAG: family 20 glycosylhydrolase [Chthonomonadetes bacterium]|nr:family 20 glycosylhydrolase [Chthonomonadetes bacterium]